ncbi:MAG: hypothetical protein ACHQ49_11795 [Elusimicrobiota bacterium]
MLRRAPIALTLALIAAPAWSQFHPDELAAAGRDPKMYTLDETSIRIEKIGPSAPPAKTKSPAAVGGGDGGGVLPVLDDIINIGLKIWKIVVENKPVVDVKTQYATALPKGSSGWTEISGWHVPVGTIYELTAKNGYGVRTIKVRYQVLRTYGGSYQGKGQYLTAVTVEPLLVEVGWGYRFSMDAAVPDTSIVNVGTSADPVAGMMATLSWRISTPIKDASGQGLYFLQGDGAYKEVGGPFVNRPPEPPKFD